MKLFHSPGSCSVGIRILLEEIGEPYQVLTVNLAKAEQKSPEYLAVNPKGKVPALVRPDGRILTEFPVIALWLAQKYPQAQLLPIDPDELWAAMELVEYIVSSLHMRGSTLVMRPEKFVPDEPGQAALVSAGRAALQDGFAFLEHRLSDKDFFFDRFTIADAAAFYLLNWQPRIGLELPQGLTTYHAKLCQRPSVQRALA